jgi:hypothetical protein
MHTTAGRGIRILTYSYPQPQLNDALTAFQPPNTNTFEN